MWRCSMQGSRSKGGLLIGRDRGVFVRHVTRAASEIARTGNRILQGGGFVPLLVQAERRGLSSFAACGTAAYCRVEQVTGGSVREFTGLK
jgi:hypothetical protein